MIWAQNASDPMNIDDVEKFVRRGRNAQEELYRIAKEVTLKAGFPYTDPRTGETFHPKPKDNQERQKEK